jgi:hypothetical protein
MRAATYLRTGCGSRCWYSTSHPHVSEAVRFGLSARMRRLKRNSAPECVVCVIALKEH